MRYFLEEFDRRCQEVRRYIAVMVASERRLGDDGKKKYAQDIKMFRAGALLILYNAIEASARSGIAAIYDEISQTGTTFDQLKEGLRVQVLTDFKSNVGQDKYREIQQIAIDIVLRSFDPQRLFSGNVDARKIRDAAGIFGFQTDSEHNITRHGEDLLLVKTRRQDLSHGNFSFADVGAQYSTADIRKITRHCLAYMGAVLGHIDKYLDERAYKDKAA